MNELVLHPTTRQALDAYIANPTHALLLVAPQGAGKAAMARYLAAKLLDIDSQKLDSYPFFRLVQVHDGNKSIPIDDIRSIIHFTTRKTIGENDIARVVIIEDSHLMGLQAQNALLKTVEEPPAGTVIILTAKDELSLLPTIRSRTSQINLRLPETTPLAGYFKNKGYDDAIIQKMVLMSGGLPGLMQALLDADSEHPLVQATNMVHQILKSTIFERLNLVDELSKQKQLYTDMLVILGRVADVAISQNNKTERDIYRWKTVLAASHEASDQILSNAQPKLMLTNFMLAL